MAAVSGVAWIRPLRRLLSHLNGFGRQDGGCRSVSVNIPSCGAQQPRVLSGGPGGEAGVASPWRLYGALCLQRLPVIAQKPSAIEEQFAQLTRQVSFVTRATWPRAVVFNILHALGYFGQCPSQRHRICPPFWHC